MSKPRPMLSPQTPFVGGPDEAATGMTVLDYWRWSGSDLLDNAQRGVLAEFLVARALGVTDEFRAEWASYDIRYRNRKIEIKSAAYAQSWPQETPSVIGFTIAPQKGAWDPKTNEWEPLDSPRRTADLYIFSLLRRPDGKDRRDPNRHKSDPLDLRHWEFLVLDTATLDSERPGQGTIGLKPLSVLVEGSALGAASIGYGDIKTAVDRVVEGLPLVG